jgi:hypothetical protein
MDDWFFACSSAVGKTLRMSAWTITDEQTGYEDVFIQKIPAMPSPVNRKLM